MNQDEEEAAEGSLTSLRQDRFLGSMVKKSFRVIRATDIVRAPRDKPGEKSDPLVPGSQG